MFVRRKGHAARLAKHIVGLLAMAAGVGVAVALAATGTSTELGGTTTDYAVSINEPFVQVSTTPGTSSYTTPDGVLTSWRYHSNITPGTLRLVLFRPTGTPAGFQAVASSDTKTIAANTANNFPERIPVKQGYVLGVESNTVGWIGMSTVSPSDVMGAFPTDVPVGQTGTATNTFAARVAIAATVEPDADGDGYGDVSQDGCPTQAATHGACSNQFSFGRVKHKPGNGTANLPVTVPGPGTLSLSGKGVVGQRPMRVGRIVVGRAVTAMGTIKLLVKAKGKAKKTLNKTGRVKVKLKVTYTPTGGTPNTATKRVKLIKKR